MRLLDRINQFVYLFLDTIRQFGLGRAWLLLLGWFAVNFFVLFMHYDFTSPAFHGAMAVWLKLVGRIVGDDAVAAFSYYPQQFFYLGEFFGWAKLLIGLLFEGLVLGLVARAFADRFEGEVNSNGRPITSLWIQLSLAWLVINGLTVAAAYVIPQVLAPVLNGPRRIMAFSFIGMPLVYIGIFSFFMFVIPAIATRGDSFGQAILRSLRIWIRRPLTAIFMALLILVVPLLVSTFAGKPSQIIDTFRPEMVYWLLALGLFVEMIANFFWMGTTVRFLSEADD